MNEQIGPGQRCFVCGGEDGEHSTSCPERELADPLLASLKESIDVSKFKQCGHEWKPTGMSLWNTVFDSRGVAVESCERCGVLRIPPRTKP